MLTSKDVVDQHLECFSERDLNGALADYSPDAILFEPGQLAKGGDVIDPILQALIRCATRKDRGANVCGRSPRRVD
jgi:ketosteroid isomerase-like protein